MVGLVAACHIMTCKTKTVGLGTAYRMLMCHKMVAIAETLGWPLCFIPGCVGQPPWPLVQNLSLLCLLHHEMMQNNCVDKKHGGTSDVQEWDNSDIGIYVLLFFSFFFFCLWWSRPGLLEPHSCHFFWFSAYFSLLYLDFQRCLLHFFSPFVYILPWRHLGQMTWFQVCGFFSLPLLWMYSVCSFDCPSEFFSFDWLAVCFHFLTFKNSVQTVGVHFFLFEGQFLLKSCVSCPLNMIHFENRCYIHIKLIGFSKLFRLTFELLFTGKRHLWHG